MTSFYILKWCQQQTTTTTIKKYIYITLQFLKIVRNLFVADFLSNVFFYSLKRMRNKTGRVRGAAAFIVFKQFILL